MSPHIAKCLLGVKIMSTGELLVYRTYFKNMCIYLFGCARSYLQPMGSLVVGSSSLPGIESEPPALGAWSLSPWTTREVPKRNHSLKTFRCCLITQLRLTLCDPKDCSPPGSFVHGIFQARILEWVAISFSRGSSWARDQIQVSCVGKWILNHWATREALKILFNLIKKFYWGIMLL